METEHEIIADGEITKNWAINQPGFLGTVKQLVNCGRCGGFQRKRHDEHRHIKDMFKPTMHFICDDCWEQLPE